MTIAIYPGSFDPITNGHIDIATRAARLFEKLYLGVYAYPRKNLLFSTEERLALAKEALADIPNITVEPFTGLVVTFAREVNAKVMVRGLRMSGDFDREFEMALMNKHLDPELELVTLMANLKYQFLSSSLLKEVADLSGSILHLVPPNVEKALKNKRLKR
ncbi:MAG: pantetheine-phosphate adenylyltransferase [Chloroflexota bacterium]